ncbi:MAG: hypothetical protein KAH04_01580, partial [Psychrilyobacter sp.]|nr:hypothetical protein [Psychrilyobacter sp.]
VSKLSINMDGFTTSPNENFTLNYSARFNKTGELKGSNKLSLSKNWDFRTTSLNIDAKFHMRDINLLSFKKILDDIIPNELISGILFYDGVINLKSSVFKGENKILIKNFKLGRSTKVFSVIPVKTATELLKTGDGDLIFDIPISGDFDNPKFNLYGVFVDEIMNILIRVTKSPLTILNSVLHFKHGKIKRINYEYLSIKPKDDEALEKVVSLLKEDDKLKVKIILSTNTVAESKVYKKKHSSVNKSNITNIEMKRKKYIENYFLKNGVLKDSYTEISLFDSEDAIGIIEFYSPIEEE